MRRDADAQVQIAGGTTAAPGFAFARNTHTCVVANPGGNPDVDRVRTTVQPHRQAAQGAVIDVFKSELELLFDVTPGAGARTPGALLAAARRLAPEANVPLRLTAKAGAGGHVFVRTPVRPELVVLLAFVGIAEDLVRLVDLLELRLGGFVAWIDVGMELARQLAERLLQILVRGGLRHAEDRVVVLEVHGQSRAVP